MKNLIHRRSISIYKKILPLSLLLVFVGSCASGGVRMDSNKDIVSDTGGLTRQELQRAAVRFAAKLGGYFKKNPNEDGIFIALWPTKNDTSEQIATNFFDKKFVQELIKKRIFTIKLKARTKALKEIAFSRTGMTDNSLSIGSLKSPNYYIKVDINENMILLKGRRVMEQTVDIECIELESTVVRWSDTVVYRKMAAERGGVGF